MTEESDDIRVPGNDLGVVSDLAELFPTTIPLTINLEQELKARNAGPAKAVYLKELEFLLTDESDSDNFNFLNNVIIEVESTRADSELSRQRLAWISPVPDDSRGFSLNVESGLNLKPYIEEGLRLRSQVSGSTPRQVAVLRVIAKFDVQLF